MLSCALPPSSQREEEKPQTEEFPAPKAAHLVILSATPNRRASLPPGHHTPLFFGPEPDNPDTPKAIPEGQALDLQEHSTPYM